MDLFVIIVGFSIIKVSYIRMEALFCLQINVQSLRPVEALGTESTQQIPNESINADFLSLVISRQISSSIFQFL